MSKLPLYVYVCTYPYMHMLSTTSYRNSLGLSVRPSVLVAVTSRYRSKPGWDRDSGFLPYDGVESLVCCEEILLERGHQKGTA